MSEDVVERGNDPSTDVQENIVLAVLRNLAGICVGFLAAFALVIAVEGFSEIVHPFPKETPQTMEEICAHVRRYPSWVLAVVVPMWGVTGFAGAWIAQKIGSRYAAGFVGALIFAALILNVSMAPYPIWFKVAVVVVIPAAIFIGGGFSMRRKPVPA